jgi:hypothetical protein
MLVIGNGVSRKGLPLDKVYQEKVGCNAIFRDHYVYHNKLSVVRNDL